MKRYLLFIFAFFVLESRSSSINNNTISSFTFGSSYYDPNLSTDLSIFNSIKQHKSDLWLWLGNSVSIGKSTLFDYFTQTQQNNVTDVKTFYKTCKENPHYQEMIKKTPVIGIWDDKDYGKCEGNGLFEGKEESKRYFLDFLNEPQSSPRRKPGKGIYETYAYGNGYRSVRFILLDVRYHKTKYFLNKNADMLGEEQWGWLERVLKEAKESIIFICSPTQILPFNKLISESWYNNSRKRLFKLISKYQKNGVIFLSGGINHAQISKTFCVIPDIGYNLYELTSSGLGYFKNQTNIEQFIPNDYTYKNYYGYNFGEVKLNWGNSLKTTTVELSIWDINNRKQIELKIKYDDLIFKRENIAEYDQSIVKPSCFVRTTQRFKNPFEYIYYYSTHLNEICIGLFYTVVLFIISCILFSKIGLAFVVIMFGLFAYNSKII